MSGAQTIAEIAAGLRERHGDNALPFIAQQLGCSMIARDEAATARWHAIADQFMRDPGHHQQPRERSAA